MHDTVLSFASRPDRCRSCRMAQSGLCSWFNAPLSHEIAARSTQTRFAQGTAILIQGEPANRVGIILTGLVKLVFNDERGEEHLIQLLHAGEMVGDPYADECALSSEAATDTDLCWLPPAALSAAIHRSPPAYRCQVDATLLLLREQQFAQIAFRSRNALQRLAHWLFLQIPTDAGPAPVRMRILLSRRDLASLLEMTVETLCRSLHQLEQQGAIRLVAPDLVELHDRPRLKVLSRGQDDDRLHKTLLTDGWEWGARPLGTPQSGWTPAPGPEPVTLGRKGGQHG